MNLTDISKKAQNSKFYFWLLNKVILYKIPFNYPHKFKIVKLTEQSVEIKVPYIKRNKNHLNGIHACAMATAVEMCSGILLLHNLGEDKYRLILKNLNVDYLYQAKKPAIATFSISEEEINSIAENFKNSDKQDVDCSISVKDSEGNLLANGKAIWQLKKWNKVQTKV